MSVETSNDEAEFSNFRERCDRCIAQAQKKVTKGDLMLFMCNHHFNRHEPTLIADGWDVVTAITEKSVDAEPTPEPANV